MKKRILEILKGVAWPWGVMAVVCLAAAFVFDYLLLRQLVPWLSDFFSVRIGLKVVALKIPPLPECGVLSLWLVPVLVLCSWLLYKHLRGSGGDWRAFLRSALQIAWKIPLLPAVLVATEWLYHFLKGNLPEAVQNIVGFIGITLQFSSFDTVLLEQEGGLLSIVVVCLVAKFVVSRA